MKSILIIILTLFETSIAFAQDYRVHFIQDGIEVPIVKELIEVGQIGIVGGMHDIATGAVVFYPNQYNDLD